MASSDLMRAITAKPAEAEVLGRRVAESLLAQGGGGVRLHLSRKLGQR